MSFGIYCRLPLGQNLPKVVFSTKTIDVAILIYLHNAKKKVASSALTGMVAMVISAF
jgi:hypothetical protein